MNYSGTITMPASYSILTEEELYEIEGGAAIQWSVLKKIGIKLAELVGEYLITKGLDWIWENRRKIWNHFLNQLAPNEYTKATPYYQTFSNAIPH